MSSTGETLHLTVHLHTVLQRRPDGSRLSQVEIGLPAGATVSDVAEHLDIPMGLEHLLLVVNGRVVQADTTLADGDTVSLIPAMSGGRDSC